MPHRLPVLLSGPMPQLCPVHAPAVPLPGSCSCSCSCSHAHVGGTISTIELGETLTKLFRRRPTQFEMKRLIESVPMHPMHPYSLPYSSSICRKLYCGEGANTCHVPGKWAPRHGQGQQRGAQGGHRGGTAGRGGRHRGGTGAVIPIHCVLPSSLGPSQVDSDGSGIIDFPEFVWMLHGPQRSRSAQQTIAGILGPIDLIHSDFRVFCVDMPSYFAAREIGEVEFGKILRCLGEAWSDEEIHNLVRRT